MNSVALKKKKLGQTLVYYLYVYIIKLQERRT